MRPEAKHIKFANGRAHYYRKIKVDNICLNDFFRI